MGGRKVDVAAANLRAHNLRSEIETHHCDAMAECDAMSRRRCARYPRQQGSPLPGPAATLATTIRRDHLR